MKHELQAIKIARSSGDSHHLQAIIRTFALATLIPILASCGSSAEVENNGTNVAEVSGITDKIGGDIDINSVLLNYDGPAPYDQDTLDFQREFWAPLAGNDRCGLCHTGSGAAASFPFADQNDINAAYAAALSSSAQGKLVDITSTANSRVVIRVGEDHNCWEPVGSVCSSQINTYIDNWVVGTAQGDGRTIQLSVPPIVEPGASRNFPATAQDNAPNSFALTVYPLLTDNCSACHSDSSATPQSPFFASPDVDASYEAAKSKIDLDTPVNSRFVARLNELHNCWTASCTNDAAEMQTKIEAFAGAISLTQIDSALVTSKAMTLGDATLASGGSRYEDNQIALWEFKAGIGAIAYDTSGVVPPMNLAFNGPISWVLGYGIDITSGGKAQATTTSSKKLKDLIGITGRYSIEAWVIPGNVSQENARIISYSASDTNRNFAMSQSLYNYEFLNRSINTDSEGRTSLMTDDADEDLQAALQHVVMNFDPVDGRSIYVNGVHTDDIDPSTALNGSLIDWNDTYAFVLGNEIDGNSPWSGKLRLVAIHNNVLDQAQITQNYSIGVGQKYFMLFSVADAINAGATTPLVPEDTFIMFEVEQFDNTAYLFNNPRFISLDSGYAAAVNIPIQGMRIGVNGRETVSGQSFGNIDLQINSTDYTPDGQILSDLGTVIAVEKGPESDEFFLTFELLADKTNARVEADPVAPTPAADPADSAPDIGVKTFDEINATMSAVTGIPVDNTAIVTTFDTYKQQLPSVENISAFLSSHQMAIAQLAMSYCNAVVSDNAARASLFPGFNFSLPPSTAFSAASQDLIVAPLLTGLINYNIDPAKNLSTDPAYIDIAALYSDYKGSLGAPTNNSQTLSSNVGNYPYTSLIETLKQCPGGGCADNGARTEKIVIATCAATLGSALTLIQ